MVPCCTVRLTVQYGTVRLLLRRSKIQQQARGTTSQDEGCEAQGPSSAVFKFSQAHGTVLYGKTYHIVWYQLKLLTVTV